MLHAPCKLMSSHAVPVAPVDRLQGFGHCEWSWVCRIQWLLLEAAAASAVQGLQPQWRKGMAKEAHAENSGSGTVIARHAGFSKLRQMR